MSRKWFLVLLVFVGASVWLLARLERVNSQAPPGPGVPSPLDPQPFPGQIPNLPPPPNLGATEKIKAPPPKKMVNIWSLQIEQVDGKNVIRATIGKKSELKIVCDEVDLRTQSGVLLAQGKVAVSGDNAQCLCEKLTINLHEDRLILDGKAEVRITKAGKEVLLELRGEQLGLRWPDLQMKAETAPVPLAPEKVPFVIKK